MTAGVLPEAAGCREHGSSFHAEGCRPGDPPERRIAVLLEKPPSVPGAAAEYSLTPAQNISIIQVCAVSDMRVCRGVRLLF